MTPDFSDNQKAFIRMVAEEMAEQAQERTAQIAKTLANAHAIEIKAMTQAIIDEHITKLKFPELVHDCILTHSERCDLRLALKRVQWIGYGLILALILTNEGGNLIKAVEYIVTKL